MRYYCMKHGIHTRCFTMENLQFILVPIVIVLAILGIVAAIRMAAQRRKDLEAWAQSKGLTFDPENDRSFESRYPAYPCLAQGSNRYAYNTIRGTWQGREFTGFDYHYETYTHDKNGTKTHHHHFSGIILTSRVPLKGLSIRPENFFDKITEFFGYDDIDFESAEFSRRFYVKSPDKKWAYDVLHSRAMQFLLDQPRFTIQFDTPHAIAYRGSRYSVTDFEAAADTLAGLLDAMPEYLVRQQKEGL